MNKHSDGIACDIIVTCRDIGTNALVMDSSKAMNVIIHVISDERNMMNGCNVGFLASDGSWLDLAVDV